jgi:hypothetical protein
MLAKNRRTLGERLGGAMTKMATKFGLGVACAGAVVGSLISAAPAQAAPVVPAPADISSSSGVFDVLAATNPRLIAFRTALNTRFNGIDCRQDTNQARFGVGDFDLRLVNVYTGRRTSVQAECNGIPDL